MLQLKSMKREEMEKYLDAVKKGVLPHPAHPQNIEEKVNAFFRRTQDDGEFTLYCYSGDFEGFKENMKNIKTKSSDANLAVLRFGENTDHDILMLGHIAEIVEFDNLIFSQYGGTEYFLEILVPENHVHVIRNLEDLKTVWNEHISPDIRRIEEYALSYAISVVEIDKYDENNLYLSVATADAFNILTEQWRKRLIEQSVERAIGKREVHINLNRDNMRIVISEYEDKYIKELKRLFVELQEDLISIDRHRTLTMNRAYCEKYYKYVLQTIKDNNGIIYLAKKSGDVVGAIVGYIETIDEEDKLLNRCPKKGRVSELIVTERVRGYGIGKKLIEKIELYFKENGCEFSRLTVLENNQIAKRLYGDLGYRPIELEMSKNLKINRGGG